MKSIKLTLIAATLGASTLFGAASIAFATDMGSEEARQQRMDEALDRYHDSRNPSPGPAARAEESMKRGAHRAGEAIKHGAHKTGEAIKHGAQKTGDAAHRLGEKMEGKPKTDQ